MSSTFGFSLICVLSILTSAYGDRPVITLPTKGGKVSVTSVGQPLPGELAHMMCKMPNLPPGQNICESKGNAELDSTWSEICQSVAQILGYAKGACLAVESPVGSDKMYHVCAITMEETLNPEDCDNAVYLTTEKLPVPLPRNQKCNNNGYKVLYEKVATQ